PLARRAQGAARADPRRLHLGAGRDRGWAHRRRGGKARRSLLGAARRRGDRELVRVRRCAGVFAVPSPRTLRRADHRARMTTSWITRRGDGGGAEPGRGRAWPPETYSGSPRPSNGLRLRTTTQIDSTVRLSWCTDVEPGPTLYPKHGSQGATPAPAPAPPRHRPARVGDPRVVFRARHGLARSLGRACRL